MSLRDVTLESYRRNAEGFVRKFEARPSRAQDVARILQLAGTPRPRVLEVGFGSAREAGILLEAGARYEGIDYSPEFVAMARAKFPAGKFETGDVRTCPLPSGLDAVCAIASLVHLDRRELVAVLARLAGALRPGGALVAEIRAADRYRKQVRDDDFSSKRTFYFFNEKDARKLVAGAGLAVESLERREHGKMPWWFLTLRKGQ